MIPREIKHLWKKEKERQGKRKKYDMQLERKDIQRTVSNQGHVKFLLFRPQIVIYVENDKLFNFTKIGQGENMRTCNYLQCTCKYILQGLSNGFSVVSAEFPCLSLIILSYPWLSLVIAGYLQFKYMRNRLRNQYHLSQHLQ